MIHKIKYCLSEQGKQNSRNYISYSILKKALLLL